MITPVQCGSLMQMATEISVGTAQIVTPRGMTIPRHIHGHTVAFDQWEPTKLLLAYDLLVNVQVTTKAFIHAVVKKVARNIEYQWQCP